MLLNSKLSWLGKKVNMLKCDHRVYHFIGMGSIQLHFIVCSYNRLGTMPHKATKRNSLVWVSLSTYPWGQNSLTIKRKFVVGSKTILNITMNQLVTIACRSLQLLVIVCILHTTIHPNLQVKESALDFKAFCMMSKSLHRILVYISELNFYLSKK